MDINKNIYKFIILIITTSLTLLLSYICLTKDIYIIYQNLIYIPVVLSCFWFRKKGFIYSVSFNLIHLLIYMKYNHVSLFIEFLRFIMTTIIAFIIYKMINNINNQQLRIINLNEKLEKDIFQRKLLEKALFEEKEKLKTTIASIGDGVISTDTKGNVTILNKVAEELTGWTQEEALGRPLEEVFNILNEETRIKCENPIHNVLNSGLILGLANHTALISKNGVERSIADSASPIKDDNGIISGAILVFRDVTEEKQRENEIYFMSYHDALTGLYNRRFFEEEIKRLDTARNFPISIIMGDVNGLKITNDAFGHDKGDKLLKIAAQTIKTACRTDDIVARWGGDEFTILLPNTNKDETEAIVKRIKDLCSETKIEGMNVSISFGYDTKENFDKNILTCLKCAENYMYKHKVAESNNIMRNIINSISNNLYEKKPMIKNHSKRVSNLCKKIGIAMDLTATEIYELEVCGLLHDIGKIAIDDNILNKTGKLTEQEWNEIKRHSDIGHKILNSSPKMVEIAQYILYHHERYDGTGYPNGLKEKEIPLLSRILAVADSYDAMTNKRVYKEALNKGTAIEEIFKNRGIQFDPYIVDVFVYKVLNIASNKKKELIQIYCD